MTVCFVDHKKVKDIKKTALPQCLLHMLSVW